MMVDYQTTGSILSTPKWDFGNPTEWRISLGADLNDAKWPHIDLTLDVGSRWGDHAELSCFVDDPKTREEAEAVLQGFYDLAKQLNSDLEYIKTLLDEKFGA